MLIKAPLGELFKLVAPNSQLRIIYENKKQMCPYNFYSVSKNKVYLFKIKIEITKTDGNVFYDEIDFNNVDIESISDNLFKINFKDISVLKQYDEARSGENPTISSVRYFIVLKNKYDYNQRLITFRKRPYRNRLL